MSVIRIPWVLGISDSDYLILLSLGKKNKINGQSARALHEKKKPSISGSQKPDLSSHNGDSQPYKFLDPKPLD